MKLHLQGRQEGRENLHGRGPEGDDRPIKPRSTTRPSFIPFWVKVVVALALGLGTMVGWKRIVVTVGEKIGKTAPDLCPGRVGRARRRRHDRGRRPTACRSRPRTSCPRASPARWRPTGAAMVDGPLDRARLGDDVAGGDDHRRLALFRAAPVRLIWRKLKKRGSVARPTPFLCSGQLFAWQKLGIDLALHHRRVTRALERARRE
jgi:hypothetical protein